MIDRLIIKRVEAMMMTRLKKKMRSTRNQKVDRKRWGIKRLVIPASRRSARVSKQSCGERTDVTATPRKGVRPGELRTNRGPPLSPGWLRRSGTPRALPFRAHSLNLDNSTPRGFCSRIKRKRMWPYDTGNSGEEEEKTRILGISANLWVVVDLLLSVCKDSPSSDLNLNNNIEVVVGTPAELGRARIASKGPFGTWASKWGPRNRTHNGTVSEPWCKWHGSQF